jgi:CPA1 family monovalent cation:H+ antiporter
VADRRGLLEITVTSVAEYGSFVAADIVLGSGVLAAVAAGLLCGNYAAPRGMSAASRHAVTSFWDYVAFVLNSLVFLLLGASLHPQGGTMVPLLRALKLSNGRPVSAA